MTDGIKKNVPQKSGDEVASEKESAVGSISASGVSHSVRRVNVRCFFVAQSDSQRGQSDDAGDDYEDSW